ncbi:dihydropteroate synthase [Trueperella bialowiezensis]|uniref:Dihydropteroate synthase n=1 Tax=Trueperella bialowiezensis TaxID=312285 RepID=A0A3S4YYK6_9ACTO|nr:dihydropteroate synthase [Trueperella bialowiezensis]VEI13655.1 Dihydropteroate synthase 1 [Trueperella bialowiezensis]
MKIMGILNVTPNSFSDGGNYIDPDVAIRHGRALISDGAQIIDVGGESTRPGAEPVPAEEEWERIAGVVATLAKETTVSVDTYHAYTAKKSVEAGAHIVNDVTGGQGDPAMFATVAELDCRYILQHGRGNAQSMNELAQYDDVVATVRSELLESRDRAVAAGIAPERIILDPGLGFAKVGDMDWQVLRGLEAFLGEGHPVLIGQSRKRFLGPVTVGDNRDVATAVISGLLADRGVWAVRVHNVAATATAMNVHAALAGQMTDSGEGTP